MKFITKPYIVLIALILLVSCNTNKTHKDQVAAAISSLESPFFMSTLTPSVLIEKSGIQDGVLPLTQEAFIGFFINGKKTGINQEEQVQIVVAESGGIIPNAYLFIALKDAADFEKALVDELGAKIQEKNGKKYYRNEEYSFVVAWSNSLAIASNIPISLDNIFSKSNINSKKAALALVELLNTTESGAVHDNFRSFMDKEGDIYTYFHGQNIYNALSRTRFVPVKNKREIKLLLEGSIIESVLNFNDDKIEWNSEYLLSDSLMAKLKFMSNKSISIEMLNYGMSAKPMMVISTALIPEEGFSLLNEYSSTEETQRMDSVFKTLDIKKEDLEKMFAGEMLFMMDHLDSTSNIDINNSNIKPIYGIALKVLDSKNLISLLDNKLTKEDGLYLAEEEQYLLVHNDVLFVSNSKEWANQISLGKGVKVEGGEWSNSSFGFKINQINEDLLSGDLEEFSVFISEILDVTGQVSNANSSFVLNMNETGKNALRYIVELLVEEYDLYLDSNNDELQDILDEEVINSVLEEVDVNKILETIEEIGKEF